MSGFGSGVWQRAHATTSNSNIHAMSRNLFAASVSFFLLLGIGFAAAISRISYHWDIQHWNQWTFIGFGIAVLAVALIGTLVFESSDIPAISLFGYALVAGPFGLLVGPILAAYSPQTVVKVFGLTLVLVAVLGVIGAVIPDSLESWAGWLLTGLLILLLGYFVVPILGVFGFHALGAMKLLDWIGVVLFGGFVIFDMNRAMRLPRTLDNSIDAAAALFIDFMNLFIRLLGLMGDD